MCVYWDHKFYFTQWDSNVLMVALLWPWSLFCTHVFWLLNESLIKRLNYMKALTVLKYQQKCMIKVKSLFLFGLVQGFYSEISTTNLFHRHTHCIVCIPFKQFFVKKRYFNLFLCKPSVFSSSKYSSYLLGFYLRESVMSNLPFRHMVSGRLLKARWSCTIYW